MSIVELLASVQFVTDANGNRQAVLELSSVYPCSNPGRACTADDLRWGADFPLLYSHGLNLRHFREQ